MNTVPRLATRPLGRTGLQVSPLGLAALSFAGNRSGPGLSPDDVVRAFHEHGVNLFLANYMMPRICDGVRRLIHDGYRDQIILASEVGIPFAGSVRRGLERHLRLLGTDYLDLWLYGWVRAEWHVRDSVWDEMARLRALGMTRAIGYSSHDRPLAARLARILDPDVLMIRYNAAHRGAETEVFQALADDVEARPGVIAYTATRWGMLLQPHPDQGFQRPLDAAECYRFVLGHPAVDTAWCAARSLNELQEDVAGVARGPLDPDRADEARRFGDIVHATARGGRRWMFGPSSS
jgi:aryl-alcohol dehydrogenase-like predicted oxidoreductase